MFTTYSTTVMIYRNTADKPQLLYLLELCLINNNSIHVLFMRNKIDTLVSFRKFKTSILRNKVDRSYFQQLITPYIVNYSNNFLK